MTQFSASGYVRDDFEALLFVDYPYDMFYMSLVFITL